MFTTAAITLSVALGGAPDPLAAAHDRKDPTHVMHLMFVSSSLEMLTKNELLVYGRRREIACPSGAVIVDTSCDPCPEPLDKAPQRPTSDWIYEISWSTSEERSQAMAEFEHFSRYFTLTLAGGTDRAGRTFQDYRFGGPRKVAAAPATAVATEIWVGGKAATQAAIPVGNVEIPVEAHAFKKTENGSIEPMPEAKIEWNAPCGQVRPSPNPRIVFFSLKPDAEKCVLKAFASPGQAMGAVNVTRELALGIVFEGGEPDEVVLQGQKTAEFTYRANASGQPVAIDAEWKATGGHVELLDGPKKVRLRLDDGAAQAELTLTDRASGASHRVVIRRSH